MANKFEKLKEIVGPEAVMDKLAFRLTYAFDGSAASARALLGGEVPEAVVRPGSVKEVQEIVLWANETKTPLYPRGGGSALWAAIPAKKGVVVDMTRMNKILTIDEDGLCCVVEPGITYEELKTALRKHSLSLLMEPGNAVTGTVGGHFASHGTGRGSGIYSDIGDCVLGCKVVLPTGEILTTGTMVNPNAHGHFLRYAWANDLTGLFCGSEGTLGIVVEVALKVERLGAFGSVSFAYDDIDDAAEAIYEVRKARLPVSQSYLITSWAWNTYFPEKAPLPHTVNFSLETSTKEILDIEMQRLKSIAGKKGKELSGSLVGGAASIERGLATPGLLDHPHGMMDAGLHVHVPLKELASYIKKIRELCVNFEDKYGIITNIRGFTCDRSFLVACRIFFDAGDPKQTERALKAWHEMKTKFIDMGICPYRLGTLWAKELAETGTYYEVIKRIKRVLDPNNIMAPGIMGLGLNSEY
ncbi:MAG: FAD-binding oxidoreductase [Candidatus Bathyarchaeia archaeon]